MKFNRLYLRSIVNLHFNVVPQPGLRPRHPCLVAAQQLIAACVGQDRSAAGNLAAFRLANVPRGSPQFWQEYIALNIHTSMF